MVLDLFSKLVVGVRDYREDRDMVIRAVEMVI